MPFPNLSVRSPALSQRAYLCSAIVGTSFATTVAAEQVHPAETIAIAPVSDALTFARVADGAQRRVLLVRTYTRGQVEAVDLTRALDRPIDDPITAYRELGYEALATLAARPADVVIDAASLLLPVDLGSHHVAAGTNYPEHAGESGVVDGPFLFAKLVEPTAPRATVAIGDALLDYEVELAWVALDDVALGSTPNEMGLILCNDYTDRDTLMRHIDVDDVTSGKGFTTGKSLPGYLPVGDLFVIPRDFRAFAALRELKLDVNGVVRQSSPVSAQVWDIDQLLAETWARRDVRWEHAGGEVALLNSANVLPARALIMSGTPAGTVFQGVATTYKVRGVGRWLLSGFSDSIVKHVIDAYVSDPEIRAGYLQPGDRVRITVDFLGTIDNEILP